MGHSWGGLVAAAYTARHPDHVAALALLDALPLNWAAFIAGENRISKRISAFQAAGLIPNPLPPVRHNSCVAQVEALTPAYLANPRERVNRATLWGGSCTESTDVSTFDAFRATAASCRAWPPRWGPGAAVPWSCREPRIRSGCSGCAPPLKNCAPPPPRGSRSPEPGTSLGRTPDLVLQMISQFTP